jgi:hypothetical protein
MKNMERGPLDFSIVLNHCHAFVPEKDLRLLCMFHGASLPV